jgi:peroxiredoxin
MRQQPGSDELRSMTRVGNPGFTTRSTVSTRCTVNWSMWVLMCGLVPGLMGWRASSVTAAEATAIASEASSRATLIGRSLTTFQAEDFRGKAWTEADFAAQPVWVVAVLGTECPLARLYAGRLQELANRYADRGVAFIAVDSNQQDSLAEMSAFARDVSLTMPFLKDLRHALVDQLGATRTPEVFVLNSQRNVVYAGRIDDQHAIGGRSRPKPDRADLELALEDLLAGREVEIPLTSAVGCLIGRTSTPTNSSSAVTYAQHVAPILMAKCVSCHRAGEIGPFSLTEYEEVAGWAPMIAEVTSQRRMPPWHADPAHGDFANANRLTDAELATIQDWVQSGAPAGDLQQVPPLPTFTEGWQLPRTPDLIVAMADKPFAVPATGEVKYQYFSVDPGIKEDLWVSAAEIVPGDRSVVHHVIVFALPPGEKMREDGQFLQAYVPGLRVTPWPKGMAKRVKAGSRFIFQVHYTPTGVAHNDLTQVGMVLADPKTITHEVQTVSTMTRRLEIQPELDHQPFQTPPLTAPRDVLLLSLSPHMHLRGKSFRYEAEWPDGKQEVLLNVPAYDFNWQTTYRLKEPRKIPQGTKITGFASFDNSRNNLANPDPTSPVRWGDQSWEEMLIGYMDVAVPRDTANGLLDEIRRQVVSGGGAHGLLQRLDANKDGQLQRSEVPPRWQGRFDQIDADKNDLVTLDELKQGLDRLQPRD